MILQYNYTDYKESMTVWVRTRTGVKTYRWAIPSDRPVSTHERRYMEEVSELILHNALVGE